MTPSTMNLMPVDPEPVAGVSATEGCGLGDLGKMRSGRTLSRHQPVRDNPKVKLAVAARLRLIVCEATGPSPMSMTVVTPDALSALIAAAKVLAVLVARGDPCRGGPTPARRPSLRGSPVACRTRPVRFARPPGRVSCL